MTLILVRDYSGFRYASTDSTIVNYQVTGASGFVGSHVVDELLRQGYSVRGYVQYPKSAQLHSKLTVEDRDCCCSGRFEATTSRA